MIAVVGEPDARTGRAATAEIVVNAWCPALEYELVDETATRRPTRRLDTAFMAAIAAEYTGEEP